jgi:hypothetical protein
VTSLFARLAIGIQCFTETAGDEKDCKADIYMNRHIHKDTDTDTDNSEPETTALLLDSAEPGGRNRGRHNTGNMGMGRKARERSYEGASHGPVAGSVGNQCLIYPLVCHPSICHRPSCRPGSVFTALGPFLRSDSCSFRSVLDLFPLQLLSPGGIDWCQEV